MKRLKRYVLAATAIAIISLFAGCSEDKKEPDSGGEILQNVKLVLDYVPNTNHSGFYAADSLGFYEELGLHVEIIEPADNAVTALIAAGKGDFGVSFQEDVTYAKAAEEPLPIKAIATIIQHNTSGFASHADKNILRPLDFEGRVYAGWGSPAEEEVIKAVMTKDGGDFSKLTVVTADGAGYAALEDKIDIMWFYWAWDGIAAERAGIPINYIELRELDERLDYYTPVIIAGDDLLSNDPDMVRKFLEATKKGYEYCIENPEDAAGILHSNVPTYDLEMLIESQQYLAAKYAEDAESWGLMKDSVWDNYTEFMLESGLISEKIKASDCYTNEFLTAPAETGLGG